MVFGNGCNVAFRVVIPRNLHNKKKKKGTWNFRLGSNEKIKKEKMANIVREMKKHSLNILGLSEVKWKESGYCFLEGYRSISVGRRRGEH